MKSSKELSGLSHVEDTEWGYVEHNTRGKKFSKIKSMLKNGVRKMRYKRIDNDDI